VELLDVHPDVEPVMS